MVVIMRLTIPREIHSFFDCVNDMYVNVQAVWNISQVIEFV